MDLKQDTHILRYLLTWPLWCLRHTIWIWSIWIMQLFSLFQQLIIQWFFWKEHAFVFVSLMYTFCAADNFVSGFSSFSFFSVKSWNTPHCKWFSSSLINIYRVKNTPRHQPLKKDNKKMKLIDCRWLIFPSPMICKLVPKILVHWSRSNWLLNSREDGLEPIAANLVPSVMDYIEILQYKQGMYYVLWLGWL